MNCFNLIETVTKLYFNGDDFIFMFNEVLSLVFYGLFLVIVSYIFKYVILKEVIILVFVK